MEMLEEGYFRIHMREEYKGRRIREYMRPLNGVELKLRYIGTQDQDDKYPGEYMLEPVNKLGIKLFQSYTLMWIASGDVVKLNYNPEEIDEES